MAEKIIISEADLKALEEVQTFNNMLSGNLTHIAGRDNITPSSQRNDEKYKRDQIANMLLTIDSMESMSTADIIKEIEEHEAAKQEILDKYGVEDTEGLEEIVEQREVAVAAVRSELKVALGEKAMYETTIKNLNSDLNAAKDDLPVVSKGLINQLEDLGPVTISVPITINGWSGMALAGQNENNEFFVQGPDGKEILLKDINWAEQSNKMVDLASRIERQLSNTSSIATQNLSRDVVKNWFDIQTKIAKDPTAKALLKMKEDIRIQKDKQYEIEHKIQNLEGRLEKRLGELSEAKKDLAAVYGHELSIDKLKQELQNRFDAGTLTAEDKAALEKIKDIESLESRISEKEGKIEDLKTQVKEIDKEIVTIQKSTWDDLQNLGKKVADNFIAVADKIGDTLSDVYEDASDYLSEKVSSFKSWLWGDDEETKQLGDPGYKYNPLEQKLFSEIRNASENGVVHIDALRDRLEKSGIELTPEVEAAYISEIQNKLNLKINDPHNTLNNDRSSFANSLDNNGIKSNTNLTNAFNTVDDKAPAPMGPNPNPQPENEFTFGFLKD